MKYTSKFVAVTPCVFTGAKQTPFDYNGTPCNAGHAVEAAVSVALSGSWSGPQTNVNCKEGGGTSDVALWRPSKQANGLPARQYVYCAEVKTFRASLADVACCPSAKTQADWVEWYTQSVHRDAYYYGVIGADNATVTVYKMTPSQFHEFISSTLWKMNSGKLRQLACTNKVQAWMEQ